MRPEQYRCLSAPQPALSIQNNLSEIAAAKQKVHWRIIVHFANVHLWISVLIYLISLMPLSDLVVNLKFILPSAKLPVRFPISQYCIIPTVSLNKQWNAKSSSFSNNHLARASYANSNCLWRKIPKASYSTNRNKPLSLVGIGFFACEDISLRVSTISFTAAAAAESTTTPVLNSDWQP